MAPQGLRGSHGWPAKRRRIQTRRTRPHKLRDRGQGDSVRWAISFAPESHLEFIGSCVLRCRPVIRRRARYVFLALSYVSVWQRRRAIRPDGRPTHTCRLRQRSASERTPFCARRSVRLDGRCCRPRHLRRTSASILPSSAGVFFFEPTTTPYMCTPPRLAPLCDVISAGARM